MKTILKALLGILSLIPFAVIVVILIDELSTDFRVPRNINQSFEFVYWKLTPLLVLGYFTILFKTEKLKTDTKALWACLFLIGHIITIPIYFFVNIWKEKIATTD